MGEDGYFFQQITEEVAQHMRGELEMIECADCRFGRDLKGLEGWFLEEMTSPRGASSLLEAENREICLGYAGRLGSRQDVQSTTSWC